VSRPHAKNLSGGGSRWFTSDITAGRVGRGVAWWHSIGSLPFAVAAIVACNGLSIALVAFGNIIDYDTNFGGTPGEELDPDIMWRAISRAAVWNIAYVALIVRESLTAIALLTAVVLWIFFAGFLDIGGEWFSTWRSSAWNGLDPAFRNSVLAMITLVLIHTTSPAWVKRHDSMSTGSNPMVH
jgi:predicted small integral membrane protein